MPQIHASVKQDTVDAVNKIADKEIRTFSHMVDILLAEAIQARNEAKNKKGGKHEK